MSDPYITKLINQAEQSWLEKKVNQLLPKEDELKEISKSMLAHRISCLEEELKEITEERDEIAEENRRLTEENNNLETLLKNKNELPDQVDPKN